MDRLIRVVVADDHPLLRDGVVRTLGREHGFDVVGEATRGDEAVECVRRFRPDVVLLDITMGGGGGLAALGEIMASCPGIQVVMLTASEDEDDLLMAFRHGARSYVLKGIAAGELRRVVRAAAEGEAYVSPGLAAHMLLDLSRPEPRSHGGGLTRREAQILALLGKGYTNRQIAEELCIAEKTVKHHVTAILLKLQVRSRLEAALIACQTPNAKP